MRTLFSCTQTILLASIAASLCSGGPLAPTHLRCEYLSNPDAVDVAAPRFAWILNHSDRAHKQGAYQVQVSSNPRFETAMTWDSGKTSSDDSIQVAYSGKPLTSDTTYFWRIKYWDDAGAESPWSETALFGTGLLSASDWKAQWIFGGGLLRSGFQLTKPVRRARLFIAAAGYYELHLNGQKIGNHVLDPAWTEFNKRVLYATYDVAPSLKRGSNAIAVLLGRGWYGKATGAQPKLICQLQGTYEDGKPFSFVSDQNWTVGKSPILLDDIYNGETYDARLQPNGWDTTEWTEHGSPVTMAADFKPTLSSQMMPAIQVVDTLTPHTITESSPGVYVYDFGQNMSGWAKIKVQGASGTTLHIRYAELVDTDGSIRVDNLRSARSTDTYILKGDSNGEEYEAHFTYHGFRYAELSGIPGVPTLDTIRAREVRTAVESTGNFASSHSLLNGIQHMFVWSIKSNYASLPTDCDQRDERLGWMADAHLSAETAMMNFDTAAFYTNFLRDIQDSQGAEGEVPNIAPYIKQFNPTRVGDPAWGLAYPLFAQFMYENYGDKRILEQHYAGLKAWADFLHRHAPEGIVDYSYFGDWVAIDPTSKIFAGTWAYIKAIDTVSMAAAVLGKEDEAAQYRALAESVRAACNKRFSNADGVFDTGSQAAQILALEGHIMPSAREGNAMSRLLDDLNYYHNVHLTTGILGTKYLFPLLAARGHADLAYEVLTQPDYPGYGFMLSRGATTLWELWQERTGPEMNSHDHHMFASAGTFLYNVLAGINRGEGVGYENIRIQPELVHGLNWVSAATGTLRGQIVSAWNRIGPGYELKVTIPVGSTATVHLPLLKLEDPAIFESGNPLWLKNLPQGGVTGVSGIRREGQSVLCTAGSGTYVFTMRENQGAAPPQR